MMMLSSCAKSGRGGPESGSKEISLWMWPRLHFFKANLIFDSELNLLSFELNFSTFHLMVGAMCKLERELLFGVVHFF